jgi:hypothetical protein
MNPSIVEDLVKDRNLFRALMNVDPATITCRHSMIKFMNYVRLHTSSSETDLLFSAIPKHMTEFIADPSVNLVQQQLPRELLMTQSLLLSKGLSPTLPVRFESDSSNFSFLKLEVMLKNYLQDAPFPDLIELTHALFTTSVHAVHNSTALNSYRSIISTYQDWLLPEIMERDLR